jgi:hypothetical protein
LVGVEQSDIHSVPEIQSLVDNEDVRLPVSRVNPQSRNSGDGDIRYGLIVTAVRMNGDLTTFVRDKQSVATCDTSIRMRIEFGACIFIVPGGCRCGYAKDMFHKPRAKIRRGPGLSNISGD